MTKAAPHVEIVLELLRWHAGYDSSAEFAETPETPSVDWRDVVAFASAHFVLPALAEPLRRRTSNGVPADAALFLDGVEAANRVRNAELRDFTLDLSARLNRLDIEPIALKGAAFLLNDGGGGAPAPWRFMQDIDLLVPEERLLECVGVLRKRGFAESKSSYDPGEEAHYPPLISPCQTFSVELHTRLFALDDFELPAFSVAREAVAVQHAGAEVLVPSPRHRLMHILAHAQLHNRNYVRRRLVLKDVLDLSRLAQECGLRLSPERAASLFTAPRAAEAARALLTVWALVTADRPARVADEAAGRWARSAIARISWPRWRRRLAGPCDMVRLELARLKTEPAHLARRMHTLTSRERLGHVVSSWRSKQRQLNWK